MHFFAKSSCNFFSIEITNTTGHTTYHNHTSTDNLAWTFFKNILVFWYSKTINNFNPILFVGKGGGRAKTPTLRISLKYLQNYLLNWLEIFRVRSSDCLKAVLIKLLKIGVKKALNHALSWMTSYRKNDSKTFPSFFSIIFHFLSFPCCVC